MRQQVLFIPMNIDIISKSDEALHFVLLMYLTQTKRYDEYDIVSVSLSNIKNQYVAIVVVNIIKEREPSDEESYSTEQKFNPF